MKKVILLMLMTFFLSSAFSFASAQDAEILNYDKVVRSIDYPTECRELGIEGTVTVKLTVGEDDNLISYKVLYSPSEQLTEVVVAAIKDLKFKSNKQTSIILPIKFRLSI
jgi:TonB family protein